MHFHFPQALAARARLNSLNLMGTLAYIQHAELSHQKGALDSIKIWIAAADVEQNGFSRRDLHDVRESEHMRSNYTTSSWWWWDDALIFSTLYIYALAARTVLKRIVHNDFIIYSRRHSLCQQTESWAWISKTLRARFSILFGTNSQNTTCKCA